MSFIAALSTIKTNQEKKKLGKDLAIPFGFERLDKVHPGITKGNYTLISSLQKTGKTNIVNYIYVINLIDFLYNNKTSIKAKVFYFSLELTKQQLYHQFMCHRLFIKHNVRIDIRELNSLFKGDYINDQVITWIEEDKEWFDLLESTVEIIESIKNVFGIYKYVRSFMEKPEIGSFKERKPYDFVDDDGIRRSGEKLENYQYVDDDLFVFCIIDNYNNFTPEKGTKLYDSIGKWSGDYAITLRNTFRCNIVGIQQQGIKLIWKNQFYFILFNISYIN